MDSGSGAVSSEAGLTASASDVDYAVIEGGGVVYEMYGPQGPCASNLIGNELIIYHSTGTLKVCLSIVQVPVNPPACWRPDCGMIDLFLANPFTYEPDPRDSDPTGTDLIRADRLWTMDGPDDRWLLYDTTPGTTSLHDLGNILGGDDPDYVDR